MIRSVCDEVLNDKNANAKTRDLRATGLRLMGEVGCFETYLSATLMLVSPRRSVRSRSLERTMTKLRGPRQCRLVPGIRREGRGCSDRFCLARSIDACSSDNVLVSFRLTRSTAHVEIIDKNSFLLRSAE